MCTFRKTDLHSLDTGPNQTEFSGFIYGKCVEKRSLFRLTELNFVISESDLTYNIVLNLRKHAPQVIKQH